MPSECFGLYLKPVSLGIEQKSLSIPMSPEEIPCQCLRFFILEAGDFAAIPSDIHQLDPRYQKPLNSFQADRFLEVSRATACKGS